MSGRVPWVIAGAAALGIAALLATSRSGRAAGHPDPRPLVTAERILPPGLVHRTPGALEAYAAARSAPHILDGVYCYCECAKNFGHRSLLSCFESDHGSQCDICINEALLATRLAAQGQSLEDIRRAIDQQYGG